ncbi:hypothetical protein Hanom_Chr05g00461351 [Helianthus anomalus]
MMSQKSHSHLCLHHCVALFPQVSINSLQAQVSFLTLCLMVQSCMGACTNPPPPPPMPRQEAQSSPLNNFSSWLNPLASSAVAASLQPASYVNQGFPVTSQPHLTDLLAQLSQQLVSNNTWQAASGWLGQQTHSLGSTQLNNSLARAGTSLDVHSMPYKPSSLSCFSDEITNHVFQNKIKMPSNIKTYDGMGDPEDHLQVFTRVATTGRWNNVECCHMFMQTLIRPNLAERPRGSADFTHQRRCTRA